MSVSERQVHRELEWRKCLRDPVYFLDTYWNIEIIGSGYSVAGLREYQREDVRQMYAACTGDELQRGVYLKGRQIGFTTVALGFAFWDAFFHPNHPWLGAQQSEDEAKATLRTKVKTPYLMLPAWMRDRGPKLTTDNTQEMLFDNGSSITAVHSGEAAARGKASYGVIMDEAAFMEDAAALFAALDPLCYGPLFLFSTANGIGNFFHDTWTDSELPDSEWYRRFHPWSVVPERTEDWYFRTKRRYRTQEWRFFQEHPSTPQEAFAKSGRTALPIDVLEELDFRAPEARYDMALLILDETNEPIETALERALIPDLEDRDLELWVWEHPYLERLDDGTLIRKPNFVLAVDVAEGLEDGDYSAITVMDANTLEEVASVKAHLPVEDLGQVAEWLGYWYYTALIGVERNNQGLVPLQYLSRYAQYPRLYRMDSIAQQKQGARTPRYGWFTNRATKPKMVHDFIKALRSGLLALADPRFLIEARTFLSDGSGGYGASSGNHDDKVIATLIAYQLCLDVGAYPVVWTDTSPGPVTMDEVLGVMFPKREAASPLDRKIGQGAQRPGAVRTFTMQPGNVRPVDVGAQ